MKRIEIVFFVALNLINALLTVFSFLCFYVYKSGTGAAIAFAVIDCAVFAFNAFLWCNLYEHDQKNAELEEGELPAPALKRLFMTNKTAVKHTLILCVFYLAVFTVIGVLIAIAPYRPFDVTAIHKVVMCAVYSAPSFMITLPVGALIVGMLNYV